MGVFRRNTVNKSTLVKLRARYVEMWGRSWPHEDEYLVKIWKRARSEVLPNGHRFYKEKRYSIALNAMRENHVF